MEKQKSKRIFHVWVLFLILLFAATKIYEGFGEVYESIPNTETNFFKVIVMLSIVFFSLPMLFMAQHHAKNEENKGIMVTSRVFIGFFIYLLLLSLIPI
jgi:hypothetical protein